MKFYQQGDVLIKQVAKLPNGINIKNKDARGIVLAEGEATGHYHCIPKVDNAEMYERDGVLYLNVKENCELTHQEHNTIVLDPGKYEIGIVQEWDYFEQEARNVLD